MEAKPALLQLARGDITKFEQFATLQRFKVRPHTSMMQKGIQVYHEGHWMGVVWNKNNKCWTVDKRLSELFHNFENRNKT